MILDSFKPGNRDSVVAELSALLNEMELELVQYDRVLDSELDPSQREKLMLLRERRARTFEIYQTRLAALQEAVYHNEPAIMTQITRRVA
jgi:hypothetical protein